MRLIKLVKPLGALVALLLLFTLPAQAQLTIEFGGNFGKAKRSLINQGYTQIVQVGQGFTKLQIEACQNGIRYWFKSDSRGNVNQRRQIGRCQNTLDRDGVARLLAQNGFSRINVEDRGDRYIAVACRGNDRIRISINQQGQIIKQRPLGPCRQVLTPADVQVVLEREGYSRIRFIERRPPVYSAEACQGLTMMFIEVDQFGKTVSRRKSGDCRRALQPADIASHLKNQGFERVVVIDDKLPKYVAQACNGNKRLEVTMNRFGDIINRQNTGRCAPRMDQKQLVEYLRDRGFSRINILSKSRQGFTAEGCHSGRNIRLEFDVYGEFLSDKDLGACKSWNVKQVYDQLSQRKIKNLRMTIEGCNKNGRLVRYQVDQWGGRSNREVLGRCAR